VSGAPGDATGLDTWLDRLFDRVPLAPLWLASLGSLALLATFVALAAATGDLAAFLASGSSVWQNRDARLAVLLSLFVAYLPLARRALLRGSRANLEALRASPAFGPGGLDTALRGLPEASRRGRALAGALGVLVVPLTALLVDRDPGLYLRPGYWHLAQLWEFGLGGLLGWNAGRLAHAMRSEGQRLSELGRRLPRIDLLDPASLEPFARQGLLFALPGLILLSFLAFNLGDRGWIGAALVLGTATLAWTGAAAWLPLRGVHARMRRAKAEELARVHAAIRGDASALAESAIAGRGASAGLADLVAWRALVLAAPEWPLPPALRARFALYLALPLGSWLGGALAQRLLDALLG
jgi:hypothetical protein